MTDGDPSQDVAVASVIFLVDGKLVLLSPSLNEDGQLKYDLRVVAQNVEYHASMRDQPLINVEHRSDDMSLLRGPPMLKDSLWVFDGGEVKAWANINEVLTASSSEGGKGTAAAGFYTSRLLSSLSAAGEGYHLGGRI